MRNTNGSSGFFKDKSWFNIFIHVGFIVGILLGLLALGIYFFLGS